MPKNFNSKKEQQIERWLFVVNFLSQIPYLQGEIFKDNEFSPKKEGSYEKGVLIYYYNVRDKRWNLFDYNVNIIYKYTFFSELKKKEINKTFKEQLIEKLQSKDIVPNACIGFNKIDFYLSRQNCYNNSWVYYFRVKKILPYLNIKT